MPRSVSSSSSQIDHLRCGVVLRVAEDACEVWVDASVRTVGFARQFPTPRTQRVSPGHLVAIARARDGREAIVWRWFDAVVLTRTDDGALRLWEPEHGEVTAQQRCASRVPRPGTRVYASAGLPGAEWWAAGPVDGGPDDADVELAAVDALFSDNGLWAEAFGRRP